MKRLNRVLQALACLILIGNGTAMADEFHSSGPGATGSDAYDSNGPASTQCDERLPSRSHSGSPIYIRAEELGKRVSGPNEPPVFMHQLYDCGSSCRPGYVICWEREDGPFLKGGAKQDTYNTTGGPDDGYYNYKPVAIPGAKTGHPPKRKPLKAKTSKTTRSGIKVGAVYVPTQITIYKTGNIQGKPVKVPQQVTRQIRVDIRIPDQNGKAYKDGNVVDGPTTNTKDNPYYKHVWGVVHRGPNGRDSFTVNKLMDLNGRYRTVKLTTRLTYPRASSRAGR